MSDNKIQRSENTRPVKAVVSIKEMTTSARRAYIAQLLLNGAKRADITAWLVDNFPDRTANFYLTEFKQGMVYLFQQTEATKEEIRKTSLARLEHIYMELEDDDEMLKKDRINAKLKTIDMEGKMAGVYEEEKTSVSVDGDGFTITLGNEKIFGKKD